MTDRQRCRPLGLFLSVAAAMLSVDPQNDAIVFVIRTSLVVCAIVDCVVAGYCDVDDNL